jgi:Carboxypeptidase regulatory-like domain
MTCRAIVLKRLASAAAVCLGVLVPALAAGQGVTATVSGTVKDAQGAVVPGATVTLISQSKGTLSSPAVTNATGDFVFPNIAADTYTLQVEMSSFKTLKRSGLVVSPGSTIAVGALVIEIGGTSEVVTVKGESPLVQTATGEKSMSIDPVMAAALPLNNRSYIALLVLAPGVAVDPNALASQLTTGSANTNPPATRIGGGGDGNFMVDGVTTMDPGVNRPASRISSEAISEVKIDTFGYQAEYGRASGLQINAVTKSGTNSFHGALYDTERHSDWGNANSQTNILNGDPENLIDERDWGWAIGGPVGKTGGNNKLFFYYNQEFNPRTVGNRVFRYRVPTELERAGDFSKSTDNQGNPFPFIKNPAVSGTCSSANTAACFADGGVLGRIPASALYATGLNVLNWWPKPNLELTPGQNFNYQTTYPTTKILGWQPVVRLDYQPTTKLRANFRYQQYQQPNNPIPGTIPGFNDTTQDDFGIYTWSSVINYTLNSSTFLEGSFGRNTHHQEGCSIVGGDPNWCITGDAISPLANRNKAGFGAIPYLFPDATLIDPSTISYQILNNVPDISVWDGTRVQATPTFQWGSRIANAPPGNNNPFTNFILDTKAANANLTLTKVSGAHTFKGGYYYGNSVQKRGQGNIFGTINFGNDTLNPLDTGFGFSNAALGIFSSYSQLSRWGEGAYTSINHEAFIQDNWKVHSRLTLDYGLRFVHQVPNHDGYFNDSNFFPDQWKASDAPRLYVFGCDNGVYPCAAANRRAMDPKTGQFVGTSAQASVIVGTMVPNVGNPANGLILAGQGISKTGFTYPALRYAPRFGGAWDIRGNQQFVLRGATGVFFDRPPVNSIYATTSNPPKSQNVTVRYGNLQDISTAGLTTVAPPAITVFEYDNDYPASYQWNIGLQTVLPFTSALDVSYTGQHSYSTQNTVNLNSIDLGVAYLPQYQDPTLAPNGVATSLVNTNVNQMRYYTGYGNITQNQPRGWRTYHSIQMSWTRRMRDGVAFGFTDTISLSDTQQSTARLQHNPDGTITERADQAQADELLGNNQPQTHIMRANFVWQLPRITNATGAMKPVAALANDWNLAGIWSGATGASYSVNLNYVSGGGTTANVALTGSPDFAPRALIVGDTGSGCSSNPYQQFNTAAFQGPLAGSVGLDSGSGYLRGCFISSLDLSISRTIRLGGAKAVQLRFDLFNAFNQAGITDRNTTMNLANTSAGAATAITNLPYDASGNLNPSLSLPRNAGFGVATNYQVPRSVQAQIRFTF